jgi:hypothetical protein
MEPYSLHTWENLEIFVALHQGRDGTGRSGTQNREMKIKLHIYMYSIPGNTSIQTQKKI